MKIIYPLLILVLIAASCKKDGSDKGANAKIYLLAKARYINQRSPETVDTYAYDDKNRVIEFKTEGGSSLFKYTYDDQDRVATVLTYNLQINNNPVLFYTDTYTYHDNFITAQRVNADGSYYGSYSFTLNTFNQVEELTSGNIEYKYDSRGNVISYVEKNNPGINGNYTYDDKKHPLSMIVGRNVHLMYLSVGFPVSHINNILTNSAISDPYVYTYNKDGFPLTCTVTTSGYNSTISYEYIIK